MGVNSSAITPASQALVQIRPMGIRGRAISGRNNFWFPAVVGYPTKEVPRLSSCHLEWPHAACIQSTLAIPAIFRFVEMIWTWSVGQISTLLAVPWQQWPLWKQILLVLVLAAVIWVLYKAAIELFAAGERILLAFARLLIVLVTTLASIVFAGLIALGGVWLMNHLDNDLIRLPVAFNQTSSSPAPSPTNPISPAEQPAERGSLDPNRCRLT